MIRINLLLCLAFTGIALGAPDLAKDTENKVFRLVNRVNWLPDGKSFWYSIQTSAKTREFVYIQAETGARKSGPDLKSLGLPEAQQVKTSTLKVERKQTKRTGVESGIRFVNELDSDLDLFWVNQSGEQIRYGKVRAKDDREQHTFEGHVWLLTGPAGEPIAYLEAGATMQTFVIDGQGAKPEEKKAETATKGDVSPDGKWSILMEEGRLKLRDLQTGKDARFETSMDGKVPFHGKAEWSPDSQAFVVSSCPPVSVSRVRLIESRPGNQLQPRLREFDYAKPGDALPNPIPVVFRLKPGGYDWTRLKPELFPNPFTLSQRVNVRWSKDGAEFFFDYNQRGHQLYRILAADTKTGSVRVVVEETSKTFIDYSQKTWRHWLDQTGELLWMSERDGWCHLWLYNAKTGEVKNQVTKGSWPVREVLRVDEEEREVWFLASGLKASEDPYHKHLCRVNLDGSGFVQLTEGNGQHKVEFSPTREYIIDTWSRADHPAVTELRRSRDGKLVCKLEAAEAKELLAAGWTMPERFVAKGRDGKTDIHGILIKPSHFDPAKKYPVVEEIYAGPHSAFAPKEFSRLLRQHLMAELGFIVVQMDGMGTNHRGKAFHDVCWKNLKDAGFPDRIAWIKAAAQTRPWMDLSRVGIYGGSAGGQSAMRALLDHHDFYHVAVADCGCHDNRMDKIWWNEQWMGWPVDESYAANSNAEDAAKLEGELLLIVGELDNNVDPASTTQVVGALQKAGKSFEFMPIIGTGHGAAETPYGFKLRADFLVKHLRP